MGNDLQKIADMTALVTNKAFKQKIDAHAEAVRKLQNAQQESDKAEIDLKNSIPPELAIFFAAGASVSENKNATKAKKTSENA